MARQVVAGTHPRRKRGSIKPEEIVDGALEVGERVGLDNLSIPTVSKHVGVGVTSIYWYFAKKDDLLNAMHDRALSKYAFSAPFVDAADWRESLSNHSRTMRKTFRSNAILTDLLLVRGALSSEAKRLGLEQMEQAIATLMRAGLSAEDAFDTYSATTILVRSSVVLERLYQKTREPEDDPNSTGGPRVVDANIAPIIAELMGNGHRIGVPDRTHDEYSLECILDHASRLIDERAAAAPPRARAPRQRSSKAEPRR